MHAGHLWQPETSTSQALLTESGAVQSLLCFPQEPRPLENELIWGNYNVSYVSTQQAPNQKGQREPIPHGHARCTISSVHLECKPLCYAGMKILHLELQVLTSAHMAIIALSGACMDP